MMIKINFLVASQIGTGLSRQGSLRRSETSGSNSGGGSPCTTPPGSTPSSSQGSPARYKLSAGPRKLANTRSSPQLMLNQIHEEAEDGGGHIGNCLKIKKFFFLRDIIYVFSNSRPGGQLSSH